MIISPISVKTITNKIQVNFKSNTSMQNCSRGDFFEKRTAKYTPQQQAKLIKQNRDKIEYFENKLKNLKSSESQNTADINILKELIKALSNNLQELLVTFNPKIKFLYVPEHSQRLIRKILSNHPEIVPVDYLPRYKSDTYNDLWNNKDFFTINQAYSGSYLDSSCDLNKENYRRLSDYNNMTYKEFIKKYGFSLSELYRYLENGLLERLNLINMPENKETPVFIINTASKTNKEGIERHNKLLNLTEKSPFLERTMLPGKYLENLGFGTEEEIINGIRSRLITGQVYNVRTKDGIKKEAKVMPEFLDTKLYLKRLRDENKNIININTFAKMANISITDAENEILEGNVKVIPHYLFPEDKGLIAINLRNEINKNYLDKKQFEKSIINNGCEQTSSAIVQLAWEMCPKTKEIGSKLVEKNPSLKTIFTDSENRMVTSAESKQLKDFSISLWKEAGTEEYKKAIEKIKKLLRKLKIDNTSDIKTPEQIEKLKQMLMQK